MTPEHWHRVTELFHAARLLDAGRQEDYLADACGDDAVLRHDVQAMLAAHRHASSIEIEGLAAPGISELQASDLIGPYRIEAPIGAGGMGLVYRARDLTLNRDVAIKVLPPRLASDPERLARLSREAQLLAGLNHPNIATILSVEHDGHTPALVLELIEGPTLAEILESGALPVVEALRIAAQVASGLAAAHERGIIHRDLKPANIVVRPDGVVKLLDFGLGKASGDFTADAHLFRLPMFGRDGTQPGTVMGTTAYMSPEQARGTVVDRRTDVWAFGCVLYEMLCGRQAFEGETASDIVAAILDREPDWNALPHGTPNDVLRLLKRCLTKDPAERLRDLADARFDLIDGQSSIRNGAASEPHGAKQPWLVFALIAAVASMILAASVYLYLQPRSTYSTGFVRFQVSFPDGVVPSNGIAMSPDGRRLAVSAIGTPLQIWIYSLDSPEPRRLQGTEVGTNPFWSPGSRHIAFYSRGKLKTIDVLGGPATVLADVPLWAGGSWNSEDVIIFSTGTQFFRIPASGGTPMSLAIVDQPDGVSSREFPQFLPDNRHFIYHVRGHHGTSVYVGSLESQQSKRLLDSEYPAAFAPPDRLLFVRGTALMAQRFDPGALLLNGEPELVSPDVAPGSLTGYALFSGANDRVLAYAKTRLGLAGQLTWFDRRGKTIGSVPQLLGEEYLNPAISPDGHLVAANRMDPQTGTWNIWVIDTIRGVSSRLTSAQSKDMDPVWSPDGKEIVFAAERDGTLGLYRKSVAGSTPEELLATFDGRDVGAVVPSDWSNDGRYILYSQLTPHVAWSMWALPLVGDRKPFRITDSTRNEYDPRLSPDGHWVAFQASVNGVPSIYIRRFAEPGEMRQVSGPAGNHPRWTRNGHELVYWVFGAGLESVDLQFEGTTFRASAPKPLIAGPVLGLIDGRTHYDATRDGERFLLRQATESHAPAAITVLLNWTEAHKQ